MPTPSPSGYTPSPSRLGARDYADLFITAVEGGINYWAAVDQYTWLSDPEVTLDEDFGKARIIDLESQDSWWMDSRSEVWHNAVEQAAKDFGVSIFDFFEDHDAGYADAVMQYAIFGEVVYG